MADYTFLFPNSGLLRSYQIDVRYEHLVNMDFEPETIVLRVRPIGIEFESGAEFSVSVSRNYEGLDLPFDILRDGSIIIPAGDYNNWAFSVEAETASFRRVSVSVEFDREGFWSGHRNQYSSSLDLRPFPGINLSADWSRSDMNLKEGDFTTDLFRFNTNVDLTPWTSFTSILQYDTVSDLLGLYNRFRRIIQPGADLYLVHIWN